MGCFGKVQLAKWTTRYNQPCALKIVAKEDAVRMNQVKHLGNERELLLALDNPFIMKW